MVEQSQNDDSVIYHAVNCNFINNSAENNGGAVYTTGGDGYRQFGKDD